MFRREWSALFAVLVAVSLTLTACQRREEAAQEEQPSTGAQAPAETTTAAPAPAGEVQLPPGVTQEMVAQGQQIYNGAGLCMTCHGVNGTGTQLGPNLTDREWLWINPNQSPEAIYNQLIQQITQGTPNPKQFPSPMPPKGGSAITDEQVRQVAAYVYSLGGFSAQ